MSNEKQEMIPHVTLVITMPGTVSLAACDQALINFAEELDLNRSILSYSDGRHVCRLSEFGED